ncbi:hypothetical protein C8T65DRAFT_741339 [Cerioporus squamosus]|nr:hypothetical protein C8T65DRAFT_741339 [Cerioporus squamosus]
MSRITGAVLTLHQSLVMELKGQLSAIQAAHLHTRESAVLDVQLKRWYDLIRNEEQQLFSADRRSKIIKIRQMGLNELNRDTLHDIERTMDELEKEAEEHRALVEGLESRVSELRERM